MTNDVEVINYSREYFARNKDQTKLIAILNQDRERVILLNTRYNTIEVFYFTGQYDRRQQEEMDIDWFGASFELLDALFAKYKDNKPILQKLANFCMRSKSKTYWKVLKNSSIAHEVMAAILGGTDEDSHN